MKKSTAMFFVLFIAIVVMGVTSNSVAAENGSGFNVSRLVVCSNVENREPVGSAETFSADTQQVYCFLEATEVVEDVEISFVWYFMEKKKATIYIPLKKSGRWRTYSSKKIMGLKGSWKVEVQDAKGAVVKSVTFVVE